MFLELTEILRCPHDHAESYLVCGPVSMEGRDVVRGGLVCPRCGAEFPILDRVAWFAPPDARARPAAPAIGTGPLTVEAALTFLDLQGAGGYVATVGGAGRLASALGSALPKVAVAAVNPPAAARGATTCSVLVSPVALPIRKHSLRALLVGADAAGEPWLSACVDALLPGLRLVIEDETAEPHGVAELARGAGVLVAEKRAR